MARGANTQDKNSGWLRYRFGDLSNDDGPVADPNAVNSGLEGGAAEVIVNCLGADADVTPDADDQVFGESPGHAAITPDAITGGLFNTHNVAQRDAVPVGQRVQGDPSTGAGPVGGSRAGARIPAGTKVRAFFVPDDLIQGASTIGDEQPAVVVQLEVTQNRMYRAGVLDTTGPEWISSIRAAIKNLGAAPSVAAGTLWVELQHSHLDIPATTQQTMTSVPVDGR